MRIKLDRTRCDGFGVCVSRAPNAFSLDEWGYACLAGDGDVPESEREAVRRAILDCPTHAIVELAAPGAAGLRAGSDAAVARSARAESPVDHDRPVRRADGDGCRARDDRLR